MFSFRTPKFVTFLILKTKVYIETVVPKATWVFAIYEKWVLVKFMKPLGSFLV